MVNGFAYCFDRGASFDSTQPVNRADGVQRGAERFRAPQAARRLVRSAADWIDLELSLVIAALREVAPQAHGRLLDVGCGSKPYESIFRPYVTDYVGVEHESTFSMTNAFSFEGPAGTTPRYWTIPLVAPSMVANAIGASVLGKLLNDPMETLGYVIVARHDAPSEREIHSA
jgi:hypothetical protein